MILHATKETCSKTFRAYTTGFSPARCHRCPAHMAAASRRCGSLCALTIGTPRQATRCCWSWMQRQVNHIYRTGNLSAQLTGNVSVLSLKSILGSSTSLYLFASRLNLAGQERSRIKIPSRFTHDVVSMNDRCGQYELLAAEICICGGHPANALCPAFCHLLGLCVATHCSFSHLSLGLSICTSINLMAGLACFLFPPLFFCTLCPTRLLQVRSGNTVWACDTDEGRVLELQYPSMKLVRASWNKLNHIYNHHYLGFYGFVFFSFFSAKTPLRGRRPRVHPVSLSV